MTNRLIEFTLKNDTRRVAVNPDAVTFVEDNPSGVMIHVRNGKVSVLFVEGEYEATLLKFGS